MDLYTFASDNDRYKFTAYTLSLMLNSRWIRELPLLMIRAENKSAGKTFVVQRTTQLVQGTAAIQLSGSERDKEEFNSLFTMGNKAILIDNLLNPDLKVLNQIAINSTSVTMDMHIMHQKHGKVKNNKFHCITINSDSAVNDDIIERAMPCHMSSSNDEATKHLISSKIHSFLKSEEFTKELQADILFWHLEGKKYRNYVKYKSPPKNSLWAEEIAPVVYAIYRDKIPNQFIDFSATEDDKEMSSEYSNGKIAIYDLYLKHNSPTGKFFVEIDDFRQVLQLQFLSGKTLKNMINRWNTVFSGKVEIKPERTAYSRGYSIHIHNIDFFKGNICSFEEIDLD
jgi:hypothetical protein